MLLVPLRLSQPEPSFGQSCDEWFSQSTEVDKGSPTTNFSFSALALETTGGVSEEGLSFLRQLWRLEQDSKTQAVRVRGTTLAICAYLQTSVAQAILHRIPTGGNPPVQRTPVEVRWARDSAPVQVPSHAGCRFLSSAFFSGPQVSVSPLSLSPGT